MNLPHLLAAVASDTIAVGPKSGSYPAGLMGESR